MRCAVLSSVSVGSSESVPPRYAERTSGAPARRELTGGYLSPLMSAIAFGRILHLRD
jgi:hypothetical protein